MIDLEGHTAVVTGGGSGIGRAISRTLAGIGAQVAILDLNIEGADETVEQIARDGGTAAAFQTDVSDAASVEDARDQVLEGFGTPHIIVNNAGWDQVMPFVETDPGFWRKVVDINYLGQVAVSHAFLPSMIEAEAGRIVNIASDAGRVGSLGETVYAGAKGGVIAFTKSLAREVARYQITVNCVCPGPTDTPLFYEQPEKVRNALIRAIPFRRLGQPEDLANAVAFFASKGAGFVTGQVLSVSGGLTMVG